LQGNAGEAGLQYLGPVRGVAVLFLEQLGAHSEGSFLIFAGKSSEEKKAKRGIA